MAQNTQELIRRTYGLLPGVENEDHTADPSWIQTSYRQLLARGGVAMASFDTELNAYGSWCLATPAKRASLATPLRDSAALRER